MKALYFFFLKKYYTRGQDRQGVTIGAITVLKEKKKASSPFFPLISHFFINFMFSSVVSERLRRGTGAFPVTKLPVG